jgi:serine O-acetyltransferase
MISLIFTVLYGIYIDEKAEIGPGFYIGHFGEIIIGGKLGSNCNVSQGVAIGIGGYGNTYGTPVIGDNVWIGAGSKIFGSIKIGNGVAIGPNSVVSKDITDRCLVLGNPGRIIKQDYDNTELLFGKMKTSENALGSDSQSDKSYAEDDH